MDTSSYIIKAIAGISNNWNKIDKKFAELRNIKLVRVQKSYSAINELPPKALLRAIKLLAILEVDRKEGVEFVTDLFVKVFQREIEFCEQHEADLNFNAFVLKFKDRYEKDMNLLTLAAVYLHIRTSLGLPQEENTLLSELVELSESDWFKYEPDSDSLVAAGKWLRQFKNPDTLRKLELTDIFDSDLQILMEITKKVNVPSFAYENYKIPRKYLAYLLDGFSDDFFVDFDHAACLAYIFYSLAMYADECKNSYLELAMSPESYGNTELKSSLTKAEAEIECLKKLLDAKQSELNDAQLKYDRLQRAYYSLSDEVTAFSDTDTAPGATAKAVTNEPLAEPLVGPLAVPEARLDLKGKRVVVFGGAQGWQNKVSTLDKGISCVGVDDKAFDIDLAKNADVVVINFLYMNHAQYMRIKTVVPIEKIVYVGNNNLDILVQKLNAKLAE